jgi:phage terminase large subunit
MPAVAEQGRVNISNLIAPSFYGVQQEIDSNLYNEYWFKGGRGSTKSTFVSLQIILGMSRDKNANAIALRRYQNELRDTVYGQFVWTIDKLGASHLFDFNVSPMQIVARNTGQRIVFRAADNPRKLKSINLGRGYIKYGWFEEVDQFNSPEELRNIIQSLFRGEEVQERISFYSYNPPKSGRSWVNQEVKLTKPNRRVHHSDYLSVPEGWLGQTFLAEAEHLKKTNDTSYRHEYLGEEVGTGLEVFTNLEIRKITAEELDSFDKLRQGLDFGFASDPNCFIRLYYDKTRRKIYLIAERTSLEMSNRDIWNMLKKYNDVTTIADSATPKDISELKMLGMRIKGAKKGKGSVEHGIKFLQGMDKIIIDPDRCRLAAKEFQGYTLEQGAHDIIKNTYPDRDNHSIDACRYALEDDMRYNNKVRSISKSSLGLR